VVIGNLVISSGVYVIDAILATLRLALDHRLMSPPGLGLNFFFEALRMAGKDVTIGCRGRGGRRTGSARYLLSARGHELSMYH